jgi:hypothetical protein
MNKIASAHAGNSSLIATLCLPVLMALALLALILFAGACSDDTAETEGLFPPQPVPESRNWLFTVNGRSENDIYVAGAKGAMFYYDGNLDSTWVEIDAPTSKAITSIWNSGDGTLYATGHGGVILRNSGTTWSNMSSGTSKDLYGIGRFEGNIYACGLEGTLLKLNGSTWGGTPGLSWILDEANAPVDTVEFGLDVASLVTVNSFFIGGAYKDRNFTGEPLGMAGTRGGVFQVADNSIFQIVPPPAPGDPFYVLPDWFLRPLSGEQIVDAEWMLSSTSDPDPLNLSRNYMGTSEGWLFQLGGSSNDMVWTKFYPSVTVNPGAGIQSIWLDEVGNVYMATDEGQIVYQTVDYNFTLETGSRTVLYSGPVALTGIWGTGQGTLYVVGYIDDHLMRCTHDPSSGYFNSVLVPVVFPASKAMDPGLTVDKFGRPLY